MFQSIVYILSVLITLRYEYMKDSILYEGERLRLSLCVLFVGDGAKGHYRPIIENTEDWKEKRDKAETGHSK
jgi:hypothetical protein